MNNNLKTDIDFEKEFWAAANELRGAVAENQYKDYVLSLLFLKHMSEKYEIRRDELIGLLNEPESGYFTKDRKEQEYILHDEDEFKSKGALILPKECTWDYLKENARQDDIKIKVDNAFVILDEKLSELRPDLKSLLPPVFVKSQLTATQTGGLIDLFSQSKFSEKANPQSDIFGRIYEYYIGKFAMAEGSGAGQFFTPGSIVRLLVEMLEPYHGRIFDPACGSGGMFVQSVKFVKAHGGNTDNIYILGQERYEGTLRLCKMNLLLRNLSFDVKLGNSLLDDKFPNLKADFVIANPPFNVSQWHPEELSENDPRLFGPREEFTTNGNANYMWMQTFWSHLNETGTAGFVIANGAMTSNSKGEGNVRKYMVDNNMIDCIVRMPDKLFLTTGIPAALFFLSKNRKGMNGKHRNRSNEILFIDASKLGEMASRRLCVFSDENVQKIATTYHKWRIANEQYEDIPGLCKAATIEEVKANDYKLTPGIYVGTEAEEDDLPAPRPNTFYVYAIKCQNGSIYVGHTQYLRKRWSEHRAGTAADWTRKHKPVYIVHHEFFSSQEDAVKREKDLKTGFGRKWLKLEIEAGRARQAGGIPFEEKMAELKAKLKEQFEKSNELQNRIINNLNIL
jgi:type I restriction enzyme M protein